MSGIERLPDETDEHWNLRVSNWFFRNCVQPELWTVSYRGTPIHGAVDVRYAVVKEKEVVYVTLSSGECVEYPRDGFCASAMKVPST